MAESGCPLVGYEFQQLCCIHGLSGLAFSQRAVANPEIGGALSDPVQESRDGWMAAKCLHRVVVAGQFGLGKLGINF